MRSTPRTIEVDRHCAFNYSVDVHTVTAHVTVALSAEGLADKANILRDQPFDYKVEQQDETFEAQRNRCAEVANGKGLIFPPKNR